MKTYKTTAKVDQDGRIILDNLPFAIGSAVEVEVTAGEADERPWPPEFPLQNSVIKYDDPFEPACPPEEWEALN